MAYQGNSPAANFQSLPAVQRFNGTGSATAFTLSSVIPNDQSILVSVDGVTQDSNAYAVSGTTLTFTAAPSSGTGNIFVNTISPVGSTVVPPDGSVTKVKTDFFISQATAPSSPAEGDMWFNTSSNTVSGIPSKALSVYNGTAWNTASSGIPMTATGGTITTSGDYTIHTFTSSGTFAVSGASGLVDYLVIAGGGGGAGGGSNGGGASGGGAGGYLTGTDFAVTPSSYSITVGAGGSGGPTTPNEGSSGSNSVFSSFTSIGGGFGAVGSNSPGGDGGSGGGASGWTDRKAGGTATAGQGNAGGSNIQDYVASSGGGAGSAGASASAGGAGLSSSINGSAVTRAGGGGGGAHSYGSYGTGAKAGGSGGGGAGSANSTTATAGSANTGSGGGGGSSYATPNFSAGGAGGSGIVIIRYLT